MKKKKWLIPGLCLVVIFSGLFIGTKQRPAEQVSVPPSAGAVFGFLPSKIALNKNEEIPVKLFLVPEKGLYLDGIDVLLSFDPKAVEVTKVVPEKIFSFSFFRREDLAKGKISVTFLEEKKDGVLLEDQSTLLTIFLKAKEPSSSEISVVWAEKGSSTVITQTKTSQKILFDSQKLLILTD